MIYSQEERKTGKIIFGPVHIISELKNGRDNLDFFIGICLLDLPDEIT